MTVCSCHTPFGASTTRQVGGCLQRASAPTRRHLCERSTVTTRPVSCPMGPSAPWPPVRAPEGEILLARSIRPPKRPASGAFHSHIPGRGLPQAESTVPTTDLGAALGPQALRLNLLCRWFSGSGRGWDTIRAGSTVFPRCCGVLGQQVADSAGRHGSCPLDRSDLESFKVGFRSPPVRSALAAQLMCSHAESHQSYKKVTKHHERGTVGHSCAIAIPIDRAHGPQRFPREWSAVSGSLAEERQSIHMLWRTVPAAVADPPGLVPRMTRADGARR